MSRSSKRARQGKTKIMISWGLLAVYAVLAVFLLFLIFKYNMLAFRYLNIVVTFLIVALAILCFFLIRSRKVKNLTLILLLLGILINGTSLFAVGQFIGFTSRLNATSNYSNKNVRTYASQCLKDEADALLDLIPQLDHHFDKAVEMMFKCKGKVIVTGVGKSGNIGAKIAATLSSTGTPAFFINPLDVYHGDLGVMTPDDVVLALSNSGQTDELLRFLPTVLHMNIPIIAMSGNPQSLLAKYSNAHITVKVAKEACPLNLAPTSSTTAALAMGDALAIALMQVRNFKPKDFAQFHPGGELGKRLLTMAADVMRTDDLPIIPKDMHLGEAIIHVSKGKLGLGVSVENNKVIGLITDGDIRRAMEKWQAHFFDKTVSDIMTIHPKTVLPTTKIADIQAIMHQYKIHTVLVVDHEQHLLGVVDHYSCMI